MAKIYVYSGASGANDGSSWTDAYTSLIDGTNAASSGDTILVADDHSESFSASEQYSVPVSNTPVVIYSASRSDDTYSKATAAQIDNTGGTNDIGFSGGLVIRGLYLHIGDDLFGDSGTTASGSLIDLDDCTIEIGTNGTANPNIKFNNGDQFRVTFRRTKIIFNEINSPRIDMEKFDIHLTFEDVEWVFNDSGGTNFIAGSSGSSNRSLFCEFRGNDLSGLPDSNLVDTSGFEFEGWYRFTFENCTLAGSVTISNPADLPHTAIDLWNVDDGSTTPLYETLWVGGTVARDDSVYLNNGFEDAINGGTPVSHKYTTTSNVSLVAPVEGLWMAAYVDSTGTKTFTVEAIENYSTALQDDEVWMDIYYKADANSPITAIASTQVFGDGSTESDLPSGSGTGNWTNPPSGSRSVKFEKSFSVDRVGYYFARVTLVKTEGGSEVLHIDPAVTVA